MSAEEPPTTTTVVDTGWRSRVDPRNGWRRIRDSWVAIAQIVVAATGAYALAHFGLGHAMPLLAATVTLSSLGLVRDARPRQVAETVAGMLLGILLSELVVVLLGGGWWQLAVVLTVTLVVARAVSPQPGFAIAAAIQGLIVVILPGGAPFSRLLDGVVGGVMALAVTALLPRSAVRVELRDGAALFAAYDAAAAAVVQGLRRGDRRRAERGLEKARALDRPLEQWQSSLESGLAVARISPVLRRQRAELDRHERVRRAMDLAVRNLRVIARSAAYATEDGVARPVAADLLADLVRGAGMIGESLTDPASETRATDALSAVAARLDPGVVLPGAGATDQNIVTAMRPLAVDLLTATGMPFERARRVVPRV
ncbi:FUSC family protein [Microbacterium sp. NPDC091313]